MPKFTRFSGGSDYMASLTVAYSGEGAEAPYESTPERVRQARWQGTIGEFEAEDLERQENARGSQRRVTPDCSWTPSPELLQCRRATRGT